MPYQTMEQEYEHLLEDTQPIMRPANGQLLVSSLCVCESAAGYYAGRVCVEYLADLEQWLPQPYDRQSGYFRTEEDAGKYVELVGAESNG